MVFPWTLQDLLAVEYRLGLPEPTSRVGSEPYLLVKARTYLESDTGYLKGSGISSYNCHSKTSRGCDLHLPFTSHSPIKGNIKVLIRIFNRTRKMFSLSISWRNSFWAYSDLYSIFPAANFIFSSTCRRSLLNILRQMTTGVLSQASKSLFFRKMIRNTLLQVSSAINFLDSWQGYYFRLLFSPSVYVGVE